jgi:hypothetical protein
LHGSYEALKGGTFGEAMEDFTGGIAEFIELQSKECPENLFTSLGKDYARGAFMGCSVQALSAEQSEARLPNGKRTRHCSASQSTVINCGLLLSLARPRTKDSSLVTRTPSLKWTKYHLKLQLKKVRTRRGMMSYDECGSRPDVRCPGDRKRERETDQTA